MMEQVVRRLRVLEELVKARLEVDVAGLQAGMRARLDARLQLEAIPVAPDLADRSGPLGLGRVRTLAWQAPRYRKVVLSQIALPPLIEGFALVVHPLPALRAPVLGCDLMALPTRVSVHADFYGAPELAREALEPLAETFANLNSGPGPRWASEIASGGGLHARVSLRVVDGAFAALGATVARYLDLVDKAVEVPGGAAAQAEFFKAFHRYGPRAGALGRLMGKAWAERYSRLLFE